jgi:putative YhbY family RNA-binding protein
VKFVPVEFEGPAMPTPLSPLERKHLKARAHALGPVVTIGTEGLTPAVLREVDLALAKHELIKVRAGSEDRSSRKTLLAELCARTGAAPVQHIGKVLVLWRPRPDVGGSR